MRTFRRRSHVTSHLEIHFKSKLHTCIECVRQYDQLEVFLSHLIKDHNVYDRELIQHIKNKNILDLKQFKIDYDRLVNNQDHQIRLVNNLNNMHNNNMNRGLQQQLQSHPVSNNSIMPDQYQNNMINGEDDAMMMNEDAQYLEDDEPYLNEDDNDYSGEQDEEVTGDDLDSNGQAISESSNYFEPSHSNSDTNLHTRGKVGAADDFDQNNLNLNNVDNNNSYLENDFNNFSTNNDNTFNEMIDDYEIDFTD